MENTPLTELPSDQTPIEESNEPFVDPDRIITSTTSDEALNGKGIELSSIQQATLDLLLRSFDENIHIFNYSPRLRGVLESTMRSNPDNLKTFTRLWSPNCMPTFTGIKGDELLFDDIREIVPNSRRYLNYYQADRYGNEVGAKLIAEDRLQLLRQEYGLRLDMLIGQWVWLDTSDRPDLLEIGIARIAIRRLFEGCCIKYISANYRDIRDGSTRYSVRVKIA